MTEDRRTHARRSTDFTMCPKYVHHDISEEQIVEIAKKAVILAKQDFYVDVGKSVTSKFFVLIGIASMALVVFLTKYGYLK